jgi:hypothetical protein
MILLVALFAIQIVALPHTASTAVQVCRHVDGFIDGPVVPTADVARAIFSAVAKSRPVAGRARYHIEARDDGTSWVVSQIPPPSPAGMIEMGGGGLTMRIDKCTGAVSEMHGIR